jgi:tetratricopeptide (TPR) repeat protein
MRRLGPPLLLAGLALLPSEGFAFDSFQACLKPSGSRTTRIADCRGAMEQSILEYQRAEQKLKELPEEPGMKDRDREDKIEEYREISQKMKAQYEQSLPVYSEQLGGWKKEIETLSQGDTGQKMKAEQENVFISPFQEGEQKLAALAKGQNWPPPSVFPAPPSSTAGGGEANRSGGAGEVVSGARRKGTGSAGDAANLFKNGLIQGDRGLQSGSQGPDAGAVAGPDPAALENAMESSHNGDAALWRRVGDLYSERGKTSDAERAYTKASALEPRASSHANLARLAAQRGDQDAARAQARKALALDPSNDLAKLVVGHGAEIARGGSAAQLADKLAFGSGQDGGGLGPAGGGFKSGASGLSGSGPMETRRLPPFLLKADEKARLGDYTGAMMLLTQALDEKPEDPAAWALRSEVQNKLGDHEAAIKDADKALALDPKGPWAAKALRSKAFAAIQLGRHDEALAAATKAVELEPANGLGHLYRGMALAKLGRKAVALDATLKSLAQPLLKELGADAAEGGRGAGAAPSSRLLLRGGFGLGALLLIAAGLLGAKAVKALTTRPPKADSSSGAQTVADGAALELGAGVVVGGQYRITRELGRGGMGVVYEAQDETLRRPVALKSMQGGQGADLERFLREARLVASLKHPRIAEIHNVVLDRSPVLVFELVEGRPLDAVLAGGKLEPAKALWIVRQVCDGLAYAHGRGVIHRDLKPANLMIQADGSCKIMDFGIAHQASGGATMTQTAACGTPLYMAPEQGFGTVSKASDLYALGVMAYELLTGTWPFNGSGLMEDKLHGRFKPATQASPSLPKELDAFFMRALQPEPSKRFAGVEEFRDAFERALSGKALSA